MTTYRSASRPKRSAIPVLLAAIGLLAALLVATPASGQTPDDRTIMEIQGEGHLSPLVGQDVSATGIVTAVAFRSFYMQDADGDGNDRTSDGILVSSTASVAVGDEVTVTGAVEENIGGGAATGNLSTTRLVGDVSVLSSGNSLPEPVEIGAGARRRRPSSTVVIDEGELPVNLQDVPGEYDPENDAIDFWESLEGMYVEVDRPRTTSATRQFNAFSAEVFTVPSAGATVEPSNALSPRGGILLQPDPDNTGDQNPERVQIQFDGTIYPAAAPALNVRETLRDVRGVVGYSFGNFEVNATEEVSPISSKLSPERSRLAPGATKVTVASYNVLNLSPGAVDDAQREKLARQITDQLRSPDVVALQEIQDNSGVTDDGVTAADETLQALVDAIAAAGGPAYEFFDVAPADGASGGIPGGNIRNAFIYNPERVEVVDFYSITDGAFDGTRRPLVGVFTFNGNPFTVVNNHLTSRFGSSPIFGGPQPFVQAGEANREAEVAALNAFVDAQLAEVPTASIMVVGDLNTFEWTNDLAEILPGEDRVLTNLLTTNSLNGADRKARYTFIFDGNSQALDHFFVSKTLNRSFNQVDIVHANVEFSQLQSDVTASDHEPLLGKFNIRPNPLPPTNPGGDGLKLQILHASDLEGGIDALSRAPNFAAIVDSLEDDSSVDATVTLSAGDNYIPGPFFGASGNRSLRDLFQATYNELFGRTDLTNIREGDGRGDITIMNIIGFDASAVGNHEFDAGSDTFESIIEEDVRGATAGDIRWTGASFPYLSANLDFSGDADLGNLFTSDIQANTAFAAGPDELLAGADPAKLAPATFIEVGGGERIGVVGATTQLLETISSPTGTSVIGPSANDMAQLAGVIQPQIDALKSRGINKIVLVSHLQQLALEEELSGLLDGVDVIIAGGSDSLLANDDDPLRDGDSPDRAYPVLSTDEAGNPVAIVSTDGEYSYVGRLVVDFDADGNLVGTDGAPLADLDGLDLTVNGPIKTEDAEVAALYGTLEAGLADGTKGGQVKAVVDGISGVVNAADGNIVGETSVYLDGRREKVRTEETNFGNLTADANLATAQAFDSSVVLSIKNGGGIRAPIGVIDSNGVFQPPEANPSAGKLAGQVSQLDIENSLRFNNGLTLLTLTAGELLAVLEHAVAATEPGATPGQFGQIGGARFTYDPSQPAGSRIISVDLVDSGGPTTNIVSNGAVVDAGASYRIVTLGFLADGGDSYPFDALAAPDRVDLDDPAQATIDAGASTFADPGSEQDALAEFMISNHGVGNGTPFNEAETPVDQDQRISTP